MKLRVHFFYENGDEDSIDLEAGNDAEMDDVIAHELKKRNAIYSWSEEFK